FVDLTIPFHPVSATLLENPFAPSFNLKIFIRFVLMLSSDMKVVEYGCSGKTVGPVFYVYGT
ncbi:hypothetical protein L9F63_000133, partial [Diploptera punctata]